MIIYNKIILATKVTMSSFFGFSIRVTLYKFYIYSLQLSTINSIKFFQYQNSCSLHVLNQQKRFFYSTSYYFYNRRKKEPIILQKKSTKMTVELYKDSSLKLV